MTTEKKRNDRLKNQINTWTDENPEMMLELNMLLDILKKESDYAFEKMRRALKWALLFN